MEHVSFLSKESSDPDGTVHHHGVLIFIGRYLILFDGFSFLSATSAESECTVSHWLSILMFGKLYLLLLIKLIVLADYFEVLSDVFFSRLLELISVLCFQLHHGLLKIYFYRVFRWIFSLLIIRSFFEILKIVFFDLLGENILQIFWSILEILVRYFDIEHIVVNLIPLINLFSEYHPSENEDQVNRNP